MSSAAQLEQSALALLLPEVRRFASRLDGAALERAGGIPSDLRASAARLGLFALTVPEEYGGLGLSLFEACEVVKVLAEADRSFAIMVGLHTGLGVRGLVEHGSRALRAEYLPRIAAGECVASFCVTEAGAGSDLTSLRTTAVTGDGGLILDGEKSYVTNGAFAGAFTVLAKTPGLGGARAQSLLFVPASSPGVIIGAEEDKLGIRASSTVTVTFDRVRVPLENVLGAPGSGPEITHGLLAWGRTLMSAGCVGTARAALARTVAYVTARRQFARPIGEFPATRAHVAWMAARHMAMDAMVGDTARAHARGERVDRLSAETKVFCSDGAFEVCDRALQLHGALGFLEPTGIARMLRDCRITRIFEGANDVLLVRIGAACVADDRDLPPLIAGAAHALRRRGAGVVTHQIALRHLAVACCAARAASLVDPRTRVGAFAAEQLTREAERALQELDRADEDDRRMTEVSEEVYAVHSP